MIKQIDLDIEDASSFNKHLADCVILSSDRKIVMQQRPIEWGAFSGCLNIFGGHVEGNEKIIQALVRELKEELGAQVDPEDVVFIGAISEDFTNYSELVHVHFWHDKKDTITGCYECEAVYFDTTEEALAHEKIMEYAAWALNQCKSRRLI